MIQQINLILASQSPRRKELLALTRIPFTTLSVDIDETFDPELSAEENVMKLSREKAFAALSALPSLPENTVILSADTAVVRDGIPMGKPLDANHAFGMLRSLQGRAHDVLTGYTLLNSGTSLTDYAKTVVELAPMTTCEINAYLDIMQPLDKAGAYGIQDPLFSCFVRRIDGCYYNVVGLPLSRVHADLREFLPD